MCNLYRMTKGADEVAGLFRVQTSDGANFAAEVYPGYTGVVVAEKQLRPMVWGFPLVLKGKSGQSLKPKPINNAREDKLARPFWKASLERRRCLIPVTAWAEAEGAKGQKTRTWYSLAEASVFAVVGIWRSTQEWGDAYSMVMVDGSPQMAEVHDRMPAILKPDHWDTWLTGAAGEAIGLLKSWKGDLSIDRTIDRWTR